MSKTTIITDASFDESVSIYDAATFDARQVLECDECNAEAGEPCRDYCIAADAFLGGLDVDEPSDSNDGFAHTQESI